MATAPPLPMPDDPRKPCPVCGEVGHTSGYHESGEPAGYHEGDFPTIETETVIEHRSGRDE